jgi:hypothetical protein
LSDLNEVDYLAGRVKGYLAGDEERVLTEKIEGEEK